MIASFRDAETWRLFEKRKSRRFAGIATVALRKLDQLKAAKSLDDLRTPPANRLESLKGNRHGQHSIRINDQYRVCFIWRRDGAHEVEIVDYHQVVFRGFMTIKRPRGGWEIEGVTTHPGEMLLQEFLIPLSISQNQLALDIRVPATRIGQIVKGNRSITSDTALRLSRYFGNSPEFWLNLQQMYDLSKARQESAGRIHEEVRPLRRTA
jgi:addiction module HigA family antidote